MPAGFLPGLSRGRDVVKVGKGWSGSTLIQPPRRTLEMSWWPSNVATRGPHAPSPSPDLCTSMSISQSIQYSLGRLHQVKSPALHQKGACPIPSLITQRSPSSIDATDSIIVYTGHQGKNRLRSSRTRRTCENKDDRASLRAPCLSQLSPLTPWQGGPAPKSTSAHCENRVAQLCTTSSLMSSTADRDTVPG